MNVYSLPYLQASLITLEQDIEILGRVVAVFDEETGGSIRIQDVEKVARKQYEALLEVHQRRLKELEQYTETK